MLRPLLFLILFTQLFAQRLPVAEPEAVGVSPQKLAALDSCIHNAVARGTTPGAVLLVSRHDRIVYRKAFGYKQLVPEKEPMQTETIFDLASLTKPIATATSVMILAERGKLRLMDRVAEYIPGFRPWTDADGNKTSIRLWHLLTHTSGLPPYAPVDELREKYGTPNPDSTMAHIARVGRHSPPATKFKYSCLNFITLQRIVEKVSGMGLDKFSEKYIFLPLKMNATKFKPGGGCAVTEVVDGKPLDGVVHDPLARVMMGTVSGNAGLFSNADDLAVFASMMLNEGIFGETRILSPLTVRAMTTVPQKVRFAGRALGWDVASAYATNGGDLFPYGAYGHTGYTGTSIWLDPATKTAIIFLTNRVHPDDSTSVVRLRSLVANLVAASIMDIN